LERAFAALEVAREPDAGEMSLEDLPLDIRAKILGVTIYQIWSTSRGFER
jgi:hypothetical protein